MAKTGAEKLAAKAKRFSNRGTITGQFQAENLRKASINPMDAKMTTQERGGMALEAGAAAGAANVPAMQQLAEAGMMGDKQALSAVGSQLQKGTSDAAYKGAQSAEQADQQRVQQAQQQKEEGLKATLQEKVRKRTQTIQDIQNVAKTAGEVGNAVTSIAGGATDAIAMF